MAIVQSTILVRYRVLVLVALPRSRHRRRRRRRGTMLLLFAGSLFVRRRFPWSFNNDQPGDLSTTPRRVARYSARFADRQTRLGTGTSTSTPAIDSTACLWLSLPLASRFSFQF